MIPTEWVESANATNDTATATKAAKTNGRHTISSVTASFDDSTASALLTITTTIDGTSTTVTHYVHGADVVVLEMRGDLNTAVSAALATGGASVVGRVNMVGQTTG